MDSFRHRLPVLFLFTACGFAGASELRVLSQPPATLTLSGDRIVSNTVHLRFSTPLRMEIVLDGDFEDCERVQIDFEEKSWQVIRRRDPERLSGRPGWQQSVELEPLQPGEQTLASIQVHYRGRDGVRRSVKWTDIPVEVAAPAGSDAQDLRGNVDIETLPDVPTASFWLFFVLLGVLFLAAMGYLLDWFVRSRRRAVLLPPDEWALRELSQLSTLASSAVATVGPARLSTVVREYIQRRFSLPAPQRTTEEFLNQVQESSDFSANHREQLREFLRRCDVAKFAGRGLTAHEWQTLLDLAHTLVRETTPVVSERET